MPGKSSSPEASMRATFVRISSRTPLPANPALPKSLDSRSPSVLRAEEAIHQPPVRRRVVRAETPMPRPLVGGSPSDPRDSAGSGARNFPEPGYQLLPPPGRRARDRRAPARLDLHPTERVSSPSNAPPP